MKAQRVEVVSSDPEVPPGAARPRVVHVVTIAPTTRLMLGQLRALREAGFDVYVISDPGPALESVAAHEGVTAVPVPMQREMSPWHDVRSFWRLWRVLRRLRPTVVNFGTAKAGLLAGAAAALLRVPCRIYTVHGLRLETMRGLKRKILTATERISCCCAHRVLCVSPSVREQLGALRLTDLGRTCVLGAGSFNGIDLERFRLTPEREKEAQRLRRRLGLPRGAPVVGFVGRLTRDKGVPELVEAYRFLRQRVPGVRLLLLGPFEAGDPVPEQVRQEIEADAGIIAPGFVTHPEPYYHLMDVFALPTHREGFPTVVLEASAVGIPTVTTVATGARDAVVEGVTGLQVPVGDGQALGRALTRLVTDPEVRGAMGGAARERVRRDFRQDRVWQGMVSLYRELMCARGLTPMEGSGPDVAGGAGPRVAEGPTAERERSSA